MGLCEEVMSYVCVGVHLIMIRGEVGWDDDAKSEARGSTSLDGLPGTWVSRVCRVCVWCRGHRGTGIGAGPVDLCEAVVFYVCVGVSSHHNPRRVLMVGGTTPKLKCAG